MTIRKTAITSSQRALVLGAMMASLTGCSLFGSMTGSDKVDYKSAKKASTLDVPPDLTQLQKDNRYSLPDSTNGIATASTYNANKTAAPVLAQQSGNPAVVAPNAVDGIKVERAGNERWLVVHQTPEQLWPQLKSFWEESGFTIAIDQPTAGIMETDWNENRAKLPQDFVRETLGKLIDGLYSTNERDKYRTRVERLPDGGSEIYISQHGLQEVPAGSDKDTLVWTSRPNDPGLEALFLAKLMTKLSGGNADEAQAKTAVASAIVQPQHATLVGGAGDRAVEVDEGFDRAWRRVGLALDRAGFTVEDRDRTQGLYFVRYVDDSTAPAKGFFSKLFSWGSSEEDKEAQRYRISVKAAASGGTSLVTVFDNTGKRVMTPVAEKILTVLHDQLK